MADALRDLLVQHHILISTDNEFQRRVRLLQALWREEQGLPIGEHRGRPLGSRLAMPGAKDRLSNYLTETIRERVRREVLDPARSRDKLYGQPRIWNDLLSSQPLCFNLFAELQADLALATRAFKRLTDGRVASVMGIEFEHSPGRADARYTGDRSAFDVFIEGHDAQGRRCFVGIEVKYHEDLAGLADRHRARYDEIADAMGIFRPERRSALLNRPLQQVWRDHLLACSLLLHHEAGYTDGFFVFLHPAGNDRCRSAVETYRSSLSSDATFAAWTLEQVVDAIKAAGAGSWIDLVADRYVAFDKIERGAIFSVDAGAAQ